MKGAVAQLGLPDWATISGVVIALIALLGTIWGKLTDRSGARERRADERDDKYLTRVLNELAQARAETAGLKELVERVEVLERESRLFAGMSLLMAEELHKIDPANAQLALMRQTLRIHYPMPGDLPPGAEELLDLIDPDRTKEDKP